MKTCSKHPKYKGKRLPKSECGECLAIYIMMGNLLRKTIAIPTGTKQHKDKKKYTRKTKHKAKIKI